MEAPTGLVAEGLKLANGQIVSLRIEPGRCLAVMGRSGSGKTLLLRALADLDPCDGNVSLNGIDRNAMTGPDWRRQVCYLPAEPGWWAPTAGEHFPSGVDVPAGLADLALDEELLNAPLSRLSTGERQRLALLRSMALQPAVLLLDEPTSALDEASQAQVAAILDAFLHQGGAMILATHEESLARRMSGMVLRMSPGQWALEAWT